MIGRPYLKALKLNIMYKQNKTLAWPHKTSLQDLEVDGEDRLSLLDSKAFKLSLTSWLCDALCGNNAFGPRRVKHLG